MSNETHDIPQDKAREYREVAALVCFDLDVLLDLAGDSETLDELREHVKFMHDRKQQYITDGDHRRRQYGIGCVLFHLPPGAVRSEEP